MPKQIMSAEFSLFAAACLLGMPLVPFAPPLLGVWCWSLAGRGQVPVPGIKQARLSLIVFAILSGLCELRWGHPVLTDYGDVWFDNLFAGLIIPGSVVALTTLLVRVARDAGSSIHQRHDLADASAVGDAADHAAEPHGP